MKRAIVIVLDGCGAGAAPDAAEFGDTDNPNTLQHVWDHAGGLDVPNLLACGYFGAPHMGRAKLPNGLGATHARLRPLSKGGKDSVTGHWEMMGIVMDKPFPTYPNGFPADLMQAFEARIGNQTIGNRPASGTQIIAELGEEHMATGKPIVYTSADSVFQIACHEEIVPIERLYEMCGIARELCAPPNLVQRVIARPFVGTANASFTRTERRKDYPAPPPQNLVDTIGDVRGIGVVPDLFGGRGFLPGKRTQSNAEHSVALRAALQANDARFIFANFEDFDMLYGHRNDAAGFGAALESFDPYLGEIFALLKPDDLLILTADHGNDPTTASTDHSREYVPCCAIGAGIKNADKGDMDGFATVGNIVARWLGV